MPSTSETVEVQTGVRPDAAVIWLHGLGADGHDFEPVVPALRLPTRLAVRFVFPHAPLRAVTLNMGMAMRAWFDIVELGGHHQDEAGIRASQALLDALVERELARGIAARRIVLAGFSQGGAIALQTGLRHPQRLAGVMALSTWLPLADSLAAERHPANVDVPLFMAHGRQDEMVDIRLAQHSRDLLLGLGYALQWHDYPMGHAVCPQEIEAIGDWLAQLL
ncbi:MAG: alpha/beta hydrolase fold domain-containing protein [Burkholderiaceae bacterium]|nr:alpha/beta hydrolase fold domain-containing protein [Burkholderiaceae bacterium]